MYHYVAPPSGSGAGRRRRIAKNLKFLRSAHAMSQEQVCEEIDLSRSQYSCLENGTKEATFPQLYALSLLYHISFEYLLAFDLSTEAAHLLQEKIQSIETRNFLQKFLSLSSENRARITKELLQRSKTRNGGIK